MKNEEADKIIEEQIGIIRKSLKSKGDEYTQGDKDRLVNFKRSGEMRRTTPEDALLWYWTKHVISIIDIIDRLTKENKRAGLQFIVDPRSIGITEKLIEEKINDLVNYPILLKMLLKERM